MISLKVNFQQNSLPTQQQLAKEMKRVVDAFQADHHKLIATSHSTVNFNIQTNHNFVTLCFSPTYNRLFRACVRQHCDELEIESRTLELVEGDGVIAKYVCVTKIVASDCPDVKPPKTLKLDKTTAKVWSRLGKITVFSFEKLPAVAVEII